MHIPRATANAASEASVSFSQQNSNNSGWSSIIGIVTAIVGNILISFALNTQRYAHVRLEKEHNEKKQGTELAKGLQKKPQSYGAIEQEVRAEPRSKANAKASGPGNIADGNLTHETDLQAASEPLGDSLHSENTLKYDEKDGEEDDTRKSYLKSPIWWFGIVLMTVGETGNFLAYGFAPASIVSPLGVVALVSNCLIAPLVLKERFRQRDFWGVLIAIAGAVTVVLSAKQNETKLGPGELWNGYIKRWEFLVYILITLVCIVALVVMSPRYGQRTIYIDLGLVGLFGGYTALSTKGVASLLSASLWNAFTYPIFYVLGLLLVASAVLQIRYLNKALQNFDSTQVIPTQFVMFTLSVIIGSAVLYRDFESTTPDRAVKFVAGCLLTFFGVYLITSRRDPDKHDAEAYEEDEAIRLIDEEANQIDEPSAPQADPSTLQLPPLDTKKDLFDHRHPNTPPRSPAPSDIPSLSVTPASATPLHNPWRSSEDITPSKTPQTPTQASNQTPFFTPSTSQPPLGRLPSSPAAPQTPTRQPHTHHRAPSPPKADAIHRTIAETPSANNSTSALRLSRHSLQQLLPGPLLPPLSSSLSGIVADSLLRGEGSPISVRARLRRNRSTREARRRSVAGMTAADEESIPGTGSGGVSREGLSSGSESRLGTRLTRPLTHPHQVANGGVGAAATKSAPGVPQVTDQAGRGGAGGDKKLKNRLRSLSETFGGLLGGNERKKGKRRDTGDGDGGG